MGRGREEVELAINGLERAKRRFAEFTEKERRKSEREKGESHAQESHKTLTLMQSEREG